MSADNYYVIRKHPSGGFAAVMGFESDGREPEALASRHIPHPTVRAALDSVEGEWTEYGTRIHTEVLVEILPSEEDA